MAAFVIITARFISIIGMCQGVNSFNVTRIAVAVNDSVVLPCKVADVSRSIWLVVDKTNSPQTLTSGNAVFKKHLHALNVTTNGDFTYNLVLFDSKEFSEGRYICKENGIQKSEVLVSVEVPPTVWLEFNNSKLSHTLDVIMNKEYEIQCWAEGGRPPVTLSWEIDNKTATEGTLQLQDGGSKITTVINYRPKLHETRLSCKTEGQRIIPSIRSGVLLNVFYKPVCNVLFQRSDRRLNSYRIHCVCVANPDISVVFLSVNDSMYVAKSKTVVKTNYSTTIYCKGKNIVGFSETAVTTIHPSRIKVEKEVVSVESPQESRKFKSTGIVVALIILSILVISLLIGVLMSHWARLNTEMQIRSRYFVADRDENTRGTVSCRSRFPSPEDQRRVPVKEENDYLKRNARIRMGDQQGIQEARNTQSIYSLSIEVYPCLTKENTDTGQRKSFDSDFQPYEYLGLP